MNGWMDECLHKSLGSVRLFFVDEINTFMQGHTKVIKSDRKDIYNLYCI